MSGFEDLDCAATVDDEAYEPTYTEAFPPLPSSSSEPDQLSDAWSQKTNAWNNANSNILMSIHPSVITQVFSVPVEERKFREFSEAQFGEKEREQARICGDIMAKTGVAIEMSLARDESLTVVITGKSDAVLKARKMVVHLLQTQLACEVRIPKDHHRYLLGPQGKHLAKLELQTATKITIPKQEENSEMVKIQGTKEGIEKARQEIQLVSDEQAKLALVRIPVPKMYHPFILGPNSQAVQELAERTGARIAVPPFTSVKEEIVVSGEKEGVYMAEQEILRILESKKRSCVSVSIEVHKSQHKYVIGRGGSGVNEILATTGVSVEVPPLESSSETITLRGEAEKLGIALTSVYAKANSIIVQELEVSGWLHRFIIGPKGSSIKEINQEFPKVHIEFCDDRVILEGPPEEVEKALLAIQTKANDLTARMAFVDLKVDAKHHKNIRRSPAVGRVRKETGVSIRVPPEDSNSNIIRIEGSPKGVAKAKLELIDIIDKLENEKTRDIVIDQRFHKTLIGSQGSKIREIMTKYPEVNITFPEASKQSDIVVLRGPRNDVDQCYKYLQLHVQELEANSFKAEVSAGADVLKYLLGRGGVKVRKISEDTETKLDILKGNSESIVIIGKKENVEKARKLIGAVVKDMGNIVDISVEIPQKLHPSLIGSKGCLIRAIQDDCGGVEIHFPAGPKQNDTVTIHGPKNDAEKARLQLLELTNEKMEANYTAEVKAKPEFHGFLIGRGGATISKVREGGVRVVFPAPGDSDPELISIIGKKEAVEKAKLELESQILALANLTEVEINIDPKHHRHFFSRRNEVTNKISVECGGVEIVFPRATSKSSLVVLKGSKQCVETAKSRIEAILADLESRITTECLIPQKYHRMILGTKGQNIREITNSHDVMIKFPERTSEVSVATDECLSGESSSLTMDRPLNEKDTILITGQPLSCEAAKEAMLALVPVTVEMTIPMDFHRQIIGQKGVLVRQLMEAHDVNISIPPSSEKCDVIKIMGVPGKIEGAQRALEEKVRQLEKDRQEKMLKNFKVEMEVDAKHHSSLIGRRGVVISKIQQLHDVQVQFPEKGSDRPNTIIITGLEKNAAAAQEDILRKVQELEDLVIEEVCIDYRIHPRIIGSKGRNVGRLMDEFHVEIKFPGRSAEDRSLVVVSGREEDVADCVDHLRSLEDEYLQDFIDKEICDQLRNTTAEELEKKSRKASSSSKSSKGFVVRGAPWSQPQQEFSNDMTDFPTLSGDHLKPTQVPTPWGKPRCH